MTDERLCVDLVKRLDRWLAGEQIDHSTSPPEWMDEPSGNAWMLGYTAAIDLARAALKLGWTPPIEGYNDKPPLEGKLKLESTQLFEDPRSELQARLIKHYGLGRFHEWNEADDTIGYRYIPDKPRVIPVTETTG